MAKKEYDLVVIGSGPGGYVAAIRGSQLGLKTAIIEKENLGGVCLNWGCIPSKALLKNAEMVNMINNDAKTMGLNFDTFSADYKKAFKRSRVASDKNTKGVKFLMKKNKIDVIEGFGRFTKKKEIEVVDGDGKVKETVKAKHSIIATGGRARPIPGIEMDGEKIMDYRDAIMLEKLPESIVIIGAGAIGVEFAYTMNAYGVKVTLVEMLPRILPTMDEEVGDVVAKAYKKAKIDMHFDTSVEDIKKSKDGVVVKVKSGDDTSDLEADAALVAIGFMPNTENMGLEEAGVKTEKGWVTVDPETFETDAKGIYAIGDVNGITLLAHAASAQAHECVEKLAGEKTYGYDPRKVPGAIYCQPQVASVGLTEEQAKEEGYDIKVGKFPFSANGKARAINHPEGLVKLIFDKQYGELLGAHIAGYDATEMISELVLAMNLEVTPLELHKTIHPHPTLTEAVMEAAADADGHMIHM